MKKPRLHPLLLMTLLFTVFTCGFFFGRNYNHSDVQFLSAQAAAPESNVPESTLPETGEAAQSLIASHTEPSAEAGTVTSPDPQSTGLLNINTATAAQLETLPGIGAVIAQRIIDYRNVNGPFSSVTALINVEGIGEKRLAAIIHLVTI